MGRDRRSGPLHLKMDLEQGKDLERCRVVLRPVSAFEWLGEHVGAAVRAVPHDHPPRPAADVAVFDVLLRRAATGVETELVGFTTVRAHNYDLIVGGAVPQRKIVLVQGIQVGGFGDHHASLATAARPSASSTASCNAPLDVTRLVACIERSPLRLVARPPASSTIT